MTTIRTLLFAAISTAALLTTARAERPYVAWGQAYDRVDATASQRSVGVVMDASGNVIVTGYRDESNGSDSWYTAKYDSLTGALIWEDTYDAPVGDARPFAIAIDGNGNPVVTGYTNTALGGHDFFTIKYSAAGNPNGTGDREWTRTYNNSPTNGADEALAIAIDASGNVIVTGRSQGNGTDIQTFKYAAADGGDLWTAAGQRFSTSFVDEPRDVAVDPAGNVAVAGFSRVVGGNNRCYYTAKYAANGAFIWDETRDDIVGDDDDAATSVVMDAAGQVIVTGTARNPTNGTYAFHTIAYKSAANATQILWQQTYTSPGGNNLDQTPTGQSPEHFSPYLGIDGAGDPIIAGTSIINGKTIVFYVAKYDSSANGATLWEKQSAESSDDFVEHNVNGLVVDAAGNAIVTGFTNYDTDPDNTVDRAYFTAKFDGADGAILWAERLDGARFHGSDEAYGVAVDPAGNVAVVGFAKKPDPPQGSNNTFEMLTVKYNRFLLVVGDPIKGAGLTDAAVISSLNPAAVADTGAIAARVGIKDGAKKFAAIVAQSSAGGNTVAALQGATEPGGSGGEYKSFLDPVVAPNGSVAFIAKLAGVTGSEAGGVWTNVFTGGGAIQRVLQLGKPVPGLDAGVTLKKILSISLQNGYLAALISTSDKRTVFYGMTAANAGVDLIHTGEDLDGSQVKKLSVYVPPKTSPGHGRYHGSARLAALATLTDKRTVFLNLSTAGVPLVLAATGGDAGIVATEAKWKAFGPAGVASNGFNFCTLATLQKGPGDIGATTDTALLINTSSSVVSPAILAKESGPAPVPGVADATFTGFSDPVSALGARYAFLGTFKGTDVGGSNKSGIFFGTTPGNIALVVRAGDPVPDGAGNDTTETFKGFTNLALPAGGPLFLAKVSGKQNFGLWGRDSAGGTRQLLRNGVAVDAFGDFVVKKFVTLGSLPGSFSASRSFNDAGGVVALVSFANKVQAIVFVGIP